MSWRNIIVGQETPLGKRELARRLCQNMIPTAREVVLQGQIMGRVNEVLHEGRQFLWVEKLAPQPVLDLGGGETHPPAPSQAGRGSFSLEFGSLKRGIEKGMPLL